MANVITEYRERVVSEEEFDNYLDDLYGDVLVAGMPYPTSQALKELDPTAYRCEKVDYEDSLGDEEVYICENCGTEYDTYEEAENCCYVEGEENE
jgi:hypothetical protein